MRTDFECKGSNDEGTKGTENIDSTSSLSDINAPTEESRQRLGELISELPNEVLSGIFGWCCPTFNDRFCAPPMSALLLSHVCQRWRNIAFSTPKLWTYTNLGAPRHHCESATELMLLWMSNSKTCPLVVDIDFTRFAAYKKPDDILPTVLELADLVSAGKSPPGSNELPLTVAVQPSVSIPFPYVSEVYYWTNDEDDVPEHFAPNTMRLRVATKPCILLGMEGHRNFAPYLVHLDLRDESSSICLTLDEALDILRVYQNLRHLAFCLGYMGDGEGSCTLPHLRKFALSWLREADPTPVLNALSAPKLQHLELDGPMPATLVAGNHWDPLLQLIVRSTLPLRTLDLYKLRCADVDLLGCLGRCGSIERLWLEDCTVEKSIVNDFTEARHPLTEAIQLSLQNLKTLGLVRCDVYGAQRFFQSLVGSGLIWRITTLEGLYISNCNVNEGTPKTWHFLRSRYDDGAYRDLYSTEAAHSN